MKKKKIIAVVVACGLLAALAIGGTMAYLTDSETATNTLTVGQVTVDLEEPNYPGNDSDDVKDLVPNEEVPKDPQIENTGENAAITFLKMSVPIRNVTLVADNGTKGTKSPQEIFYFKDAEDTIYTHANNFDNKWIELTGKENPKYVDETGAEVAEANLATAIAAGKTVSRIYVFGYSEAVAKNAKTNPLFDKVQLKNIIEGELTAGAAQNIKIDTYAIQSTEILGDNVDYTDTLNKANLESIYGVFMNQNPTIATNGSSKPAATSNEKNLAGQDLATPTPEPSPEP